MGRTKDLNRKARTLALKERRIARQGQAKSKSSQAAEQNAFDWGFADGTAEGRRQGYLEASHDALAIAQKYKVVSSIRRYLGAQVRKAEGR